jgi:hypothetical protein
VAGIVQEAVQFITGIAKESDQLIGVIDAVDFSLRDHEAGRIFDLRVRACDVEKTAAGEVLVLSRDVARVADASVWSTKFPLTAGGKSRD